MREPIWQGSSTVERSLHKAMVAGPSPAPATDMDNQPIGVLDSGVGGLTVLSEIRKELPEESTIYIGDSHNAPYGKRTPENILFLSEKLIQFLLDKNAKIIVIACNTITVNGIEKLREVFPKVPIVGTVPVVKMAAAVTKNKKIGLLVTEATAKSAYNQNLITTFANDCDVTIVGTNKLVPLIEAENNKVLPKVIEEELAPFKEKGVDTVILGSTHFPILRSMIQDFLGPKVVVLDSGGAVARQVRRILTNNNILSDDIHPTHELYTTGNVAPFSQIAKKILKDKFTSVSSVVLE